MRIESIPNLRSLLVCLALLLALCAPAAQAQTGTQSATQAAAQGGTPSPAAAPQTAVPTAHPAPGSTPLLATPAATLAPIATQLGKTLQTLVGVPTTPPTPAHAPEDAEDSVGQITDNFATTLLTILTQVFDRLRKDSSALAANSAAVPDFITWLDAQCNDDGHRALWRDIGHDFLIIVGVPLLGSIAIGLMLWPLRLNLRRRQPQNMIGRVTLLLALLFLRLVAAVMFWGAALLLLGQNEPHSLPRFVVLNVIYAIAAAYAVRQILRAVFAPNTPDLRVVSLPTAQAVYACHGFSAFGILIVIGYFTIAIATALRVPPTTIILFQNILALILVTMAVIVILHMRGRVAAIVLGRAQEGQNFSYGLRAALARHWHKLAIAYMAGGFVVTLFGINNGFALLLRDTILTLVILVLARLGFLFIDRWKTPTADNPALAHRQILAFLLRPMLWIVVAAAIGATWGLHVSTVLATPFGQHMTGAFTSVLLTLLTLTVLYETLNNAIEGYLSRNDETKKPVASARARTLLPMLRNSAFILFSIIALLTLLSAIGLNIAPVLAGAGVLGVAIGFGSQTLVKDFLTGLFIVAENTVVIGDVVKIGDFSGVVEAMSIRTIRLRDYDGSLHILPFGDVSKITNMTKEYSFAVIDISVAYDSNLDHVMKTIREVGAQLQEDPVFKRVIMEPIEVAGVESLGDSSITIRARMRTRPAKQWDVRRLLLQRLKERFDKENIVIPFPTVTHITKAV